MSVEDQYRDSIAVVYPAVAPGAEYGLPIDRELNTHVTVTFLGEVSTVGYTKDDLLTALKTVQWQEIGSVEVGRLMLFGPDSNFLVMTLDSDALCNNREKVEAALKAAGINNVNKYQGYTPHITLRSDYTGELPTTLNLPKTVQVGSPVLWWGTEVISLV